MTRPDKNLAGAGTRRRFLAYFSGLGLTSTLLPGALWAGLQAGDRVTTDTLKAAERLSGLEFTDVEREMMVDGLNRQLASYEKLRTVELPNDVPPALQFNPLLPGMRADTTAGTRRARPRDEASLEAPRNLEDAAFWPVTSLGQLIRAGRVSSQDLTRMYLARLRRYNEKLHCVITFTEELAMKQARRADEEIAAGRYRGPLHGIPWGAKDLLAVKGYPTTWGSEPFKDQ